MDTGGSGRLGIAALCGRAVRHVGGHTSFCGGISRRSRSSQRLHGSIDHVALGAVLRCFADTDCFGKAPNGPREPRVLASVRTASDKAIGLSCVPDSEKQG